MMLQPLTQFICDCCGQLIEKPKDGYVEWRSDPDPVSGIYKASQFRVAHHYDASPLQTPGRCYSHSAKAGNNSLNLTVFLKYLPQYITFFLDAGYVCNPQRKSESQVADYAEFADFVRRFTIPYFEQARLFFPRAKEEGLLEGHNEVNLYMEHNLKSIIEYFIEPQECGDDTED